MDTTTTYCIVLALVGTVVVGGSMLLRIFVCNRHDPNVIVHAQHSAFEGAASVPQHQLQPEMVEQQYDLSLG